jgi:hypothetical protein
MCGHTRHDVARRSGALVRFSADDKRASDREREEVVSDLRVHAGDGRLSVDELDARIAAALAAPTRAELAALVADLPRRPADRTDERREHVRTYLAVMALLVAIWALTGAGYFWPIWPMLGWGVAVVSHVRPGVTRSG